MSVQPELSEAPSPNKALPDILDIAWQSRLWIALCTAVFAGVGFLAYWQAGPAYEAKARILVSKRGKIQLKEDDASAVTYGERGEHVTLIMSPLIVGEAVRDHHLLELSSLRGCDEDEAVEEIVLKLKARRSAGSDLSFVNVIDLLYENETPGDATKIVDAVIKTYAKYVARNQDENTQQTIASVESRSQDLETNLRALEQEQQRFRENAPLHWKSAPGASGQNADTTNLHQERVLRLEQERRDKLIRRTEVSTKLQTIELARAQNSPRNAIEMLVKRYLYQDGNNSPASAASSTDRNQRLQQIDPRLAVVDQRLTPLMLEEQRLMREFGYGPDHPEVKMVRRSIAAVRDFFHQQGLILPDDPNGQVTPREVDLVEMFVLSLKQELAELDRRDVELARLAEEETKLAKDYSKFQLEDQRLSNEIQRLNALWQTVKTSISSVDLLKDNAGYNLKIVAPPKEALSTKKPIKYIGGALVAGLVIGMGLCYLKATRDTRIKTAVELQTLLQQRVLGRVPILATGAAEIRVRGIGPTVCFVHTPHSADCEAYRSLRSALLVATHQNGQRIIQITSPELGDGKTTVTVNLAAALAQAGKRVLLIDADLRRPQVHQLLGLRGEIGLSDVLQREIEVENALQPTVVSNLTALSAGNLPSNPSELLSRDDLSTILQRLKTHFDFILIDSPPLLAVSDAGIIAPVVDSVLMVVRLEKTRSAVALRAQEQLRNQGAVMLGLVANAVPKDSADGDQEYYRSTGTASDRGRPMPDLDSAPRPRSTVSLTPAEPVLSR